MRRPLPIRSHSPGRELTIQSQGASTGIMAVECCVQGVEVPSYRSRQLGCIWG